MNNYMIKRVITLSILMLTFVSCGKQNKTKIILNYDGETDKTKIFLKEIKVDREFSIDSVVMKKSGRHTFIIQTNQPRFYKLYFPGGKWIMLLAEPGERIRLNVSQEKLPFGYEVKGSVSSQFVRELGQRLYHTVRKMDSLRNYYNAIPADKQSDSERTRLDSEFKALADSQHRESIRFVLSHYNSLSSIYALYQKYDDSTWVFYSAKDLQYFKIASDSLSKKYPHSDEVKALRSHFNRLMNQRQRLMLTTLAQEKTIGFPDLYLPTVSSDTIRLSSLTGKVILLSFWRSDLPACLVQNREFFELYKRFEKKGLRIYQVSLDPDRSKWAAFVLDAGYPWISVWGGPFETSLAARVYNVQQLPSEYIINKDGEIVAVNPDPDNLAGIIAPLLR